ncbi:MAG: hypothetical protein I8H66_00595 [Sphingobacteriia bacterium]|nr:hypothetical protein [Sphingobacteriia bacterium]
MKKFFVLALAAIFSVAAIAQQAEWKQMHDFHAVMSKTFHPAEEGNLKPARANAAELVAKAKTWQSSVAPAGYDAKVAQPILKKLVIACTDLEAGVKAKKSDKELTTLITATHEVFHELTEKCRPGAEKH